MLVFSLAVAPISISNDATRAVNALYCRSPRNVLEPEEHLFSVSTVDLDVLFQARLVNFPRCLPACVKD